MLPALHCWYCLLHPLFIGPWGEHCFCNRSSILFYVYHSAHNLVNGSNDRLSYDYCVTFLFSLPTLSSVSGTLISFSLPPLHSSDTWTPTLLLILSSDTGIYTALPILFCIMGTNASLLMLPFCWYFPLALVQKLSVSIFSSDTGAAFAFLPKFSLDTGTLYITFSTSCIILLLHHHKLNTQTTLSYFLLDSPELLISWTTDFFDPNTNGLSTIQSWPTRPFLAHDCNPYHSHFLIQGCSISCTRSFCNLPLHIYYHCQHSFFLGLDPFVPDPHTWFQALLLQCSLISSAHFTITPSTLVPSVIDIHDMIYLCLQSFRTHLCSNSNEWLGTPDGIHNQSHFLAQFHRTSKYSHINFLR